MDRRWVAGVLVLAAVLVPVVIWKRNEVGVLLGDAGENIMDTVKNWVTMLAGENARNREAVLPIIHRAEADFSMPAGLLDRVLYQESRYRTDIITGTLKSKVGAAGIAQFMPKTAERFGIDPLDVRQAIPAAAKYLKTLHNQFHSWVLAVGSYNWGEGNMAAWLKTGKGYYGQPMPEETRAYMAEISTDAGIV